MNQGEYERILMSRLRGFVHSWLQTLQKSSAMYAEVAKPHAGYPFPEGFPFSLTGIHETFRWIETYGPNEIRHTFPVALHFHVVPPPTSLNVASREMSTQFVWIISSLKSGTQLAFFEVDARILHDPFPIFPLDTDLVIRSLLTSLQRDRAIALSSRIIPRSTNFTIPAADCNLEIFEVRTLDGDLVHDCGQRSVPKRICIICSCWIPPAGPALCLAHIHVEGITG